LVANSNEDEFDSSIYVGMRRDQIQKVLENASPDQNNPTKFYLYGHYAMDGALFYIGKGTGKRGWSKNRHPLWQRYVDNHLGGKYSVRIIVDGLSSEDAEELETGLIAEYGMTLVNWYNFGRKMDYSLLEKFHELRNANRKFIKETRLIEKSDIELAIQNYKIALLNIAEYAFMNYETGLVGKLLQEENEELGISGELEALDRLTLCLIKLGRNIEAQEYVNSYFKRYKRDSVLQTSNKIKKRVTKALGDVELNNFRSSA
jgi:hypothetical protein